MAASVVLAACGGSSPSDDAAGDTVLASLVARTVLSWGSAAASDGTIWLAWTDQQTDLTGSVSAMRVRPDGRQDRWVLASSPGRYLSVKLAVVDGRPLIGWYQQLPGNLLAVRVVSWDETGWQDEVAVSHDGVTSDFQLRTQDGTAWLLVGELLLTDGGSRCSVLRRLSAGTWSSPIEVVTTAPRTAARCAIAPGLGGELMATWSVQSTVSTALPSAVSAAYLAARAQRFDSPTMASPGPSFVDRLESVGVGRWALLSYTVDATNEVTYGLRLYRSGQWSTAIHAIGLSGEVSYGLSAVANGAFVDLAWTGIRAGDSAGGSAPRAARFDSDTDTLSATQSLGPFDPNLLLAYSTSAAPDRRVAAGFGTARGLGEAWLALADEQGAWRPAFRIGRPARGAGAPTAWPLPDGSWAVVWLEFNAQSGTLDLLMRRLR